MADALGARECFGLSEVQPVGEAEGVRRRR